MKEDCKWRIAKISTILKFEGDRETSEQSFSFELKYDEDDAQKVASRLNDLEQLLKDSIADVTRQTVKKVQLAGNVLSIQFIKEPSGDVYGMLKPVVLGFFSKAGVISVRPHDK